MRVPKDAGGSFVADGRRRGDPKRVAESKRRERGDGIAEAIGEIRRTTVAHPEEHRVRERSSERLRLEQRHRFSCFAGETRRSQHQVCRSVNTGNASSYFKFISLMLHLKRNFALFPESYYTYIHDIWDILNGNILSWGSNISFEGF